jgi:hypothetical protein
MEPLGLLGALLGGYQQGRLTKQNRAIKSATLARQQQENEDLKKYRADSLELQRRRITNEEPPYIKAQRDAFLAALKGMPDDIQKEVDKVHSTAFTPSELEAGMANIHTKYNNAFKGLRSQYDQSPDIQKIGNFDSIANTWVPDYIRADSLDKTRFPRPRFDPDRFLKGAKDIVENRISQAGQEDPAVQEQILDDYINSQAAMTGMPSDKLWAMLPYTRPNQIYTGQTTGVSVSDPVRTQTVDPTLGAFDTRTANDPQGSTTYSHAMPENLQTLPAYQQFLNKQNGVSPGFNLPSNVGIPRSVTNQQPTSSQIADDLIVDDLHNMFRSPLFQQKYGLTDVTDPKQFKYALQLYANPNTLNELNQEYNQADRYGIMSDGSRDPAYNDQRLGDFGQSPRGIGMSRMIEAQPLMAQSSKFTQIPFEGRTRIPISTDDRRDLVGLEKDRQDVLTAAANGTIAQVKARVAQATLPQQIADADASLMLKTMRIVLDPLKFGLQQQNFNLDKWFKEQTLNQGGQRLVLAAKDLIIKASGPARALLMSADNETKNAGMLLSSLMQQNALSSAIFTVDPSLKSKVENGTATAAEIEKLSTAIGPATTEAVKNGLARYKASLRQRAAAYSGVEGFNSIAQSYAGLTPDAIGAVPGTGKENIFTDPGVDPAVDPEPNVTRPVVKPEPSVKDQIKSGMPRNSKGQTPAQILKEGDAGKKTTGPATKPPSSAGGGATPPSILSAAQQRLKAGGGKPTKPPTKPPVTPEKDKQKPPTQGNKASRFSVFDDLKK